MLVGRRQREITPPISQWSAELWQAVGDEYFGASDELNFVDFHFAMIGPVVRDASDLFDGYWNSEAVYPIELLDPVAGSKENLTKLRAWLAETTRDTDQSRYAEVLRQDDAVQRMIAGDWPMEWSENYQFVADDPLKATLPENLRDGPGSSLHWCRR